MTDSLLTTIHHQLDHADHPDALRDLFAQTLNWGRSHGTVQQLAVGTPVNQSLVAQPIAQLGTIPVFRVEWPYSTLPTVTQRRAVYHMLSAVAFEHVLCYVTQGGRQISFVWARDRGGKRVELRILSYERGSLARTTIERLTALAFRFDEFDMFGGVSPSLVIERLNAAFDVEAVTKQFFATYRACFEQTERTLQGLPDPPTRRLFVQKLFNRLMFIVFLERKGWLRYAGRTDYLHALWQAHLHERISDPNANFYQSRLTLLFFAGLNTPHEVNVVDIQHGHVLEERIGRVPYLNGGLFEEEDDDKNAAIIIPDAALESALTDLFYRFNFTVSESTPFDIEVAVDPEMLGKVFEELVTGRHESGSYYTPRAIVAFMCREGLKGYVQTQVPAETPDTIARFVDERGASDLRNPEAVLDALKRVRACDPACGSGAYLLGMLQEILALRTGLFAARHVDPLTTYQRKLEIIQNNIYGVDLDPFAVNIARLRLWLSLVVEYEGDTPPPLPNLEYKVETGDSVAAPDPSGGLQLDMFRQQQISEYFALKERYLTSHHGEKLTLRQQVEAKKCEILAWAHPHGGVNGFDWAVEFAEVFATGGFDIVVANPPYVRQELITAHKPMLQKIYPEVYTGVADLYVYFYARALQMLRPAGMLAFISPNKWFRANYGKPLRTHIADTCAVYSITDFGELPVFLTAATFPMIFIAKKGSSHATPLFTQVKSLNAPYPDVKALIEQHGQRLPATAIQNDKWTLTDTATANRLTQMEQISTTLGQYVKGEIYYGIKTGFNKAFVVDSNTRTKLIADDPHSAEIIKPMAVGDDVRKWRIESRDRWLIVTPIGIEIQRYPAILAHLQKWQNELERRSDKGEHWWELRACSYYTEFAKPKIIYPEIAKEPRFTYDKETLFTNNKAFIIALDDLFLLGVLNSTPTWSYAKSVCAVLGDENKGGRLMLQWVNFKQIPIPHAPPSERDAIAALAQQCLEAKGQGAQVTEWEAEIDERVGRLYGVSADDLKAIRTEHGKG